VWVLGTEVTCGQPLLLLLPLLLVFTRSLPVAARSLLPSLLVVLPAVAACCCCCCPPFLLRPPRVLLLLLLLLPLLSLAAALALFPACGQPNDFLSKVAAGHRY